MSLSEAWTVNVQKYVYSVPRMFGSPWTIRTDELPESRDMDQRVVGAAQRALPRVPRPVFRAKAACDTLCERYFFLGLAKPLQQTPSLSVRPSSPSARCHSTRRYLSTSVGAPRSVSSRVRSSLGDEMYGADVSSKASRYAREILWFQTAWVSRI